MDNSNETRIVLKDSVRINNLLCEAGDVIVLLEEAAKEDLDGFLCETVSRDRPTFRVNKDVKINPETTIKKDSRFAVEKLAVPGTISARLLELVRSEEGVVYKDDGPNFIKRKLRKGWV